MQNLVTVLLRAKAMYCLCCRCSGEYVGEYCQYKNPCNNGEQKCQNGGTCTVLYSPTQAPTFKVCLFLCFYFLQIWSVPLWKFNSVAYLVLDPSFLVPVRIPIWIQTQVLLWTKLKWSLGWKSPILWLTFFYIFFLCLHEGLPVLLTLEFSWAVLRIRIPVTRIRILPFNLMRNRRGPGSTSLLLR
jgi:hypothetical protein